MRYCRKMTAMEQQITLHILHLFKVSDERHKKQISLDIYLEKRRCQARAMPVDNAHPPQHHQPETVLQDPRISGIVHGLSISDHSPEQARKLAEAALRLNPNNREAGIIIGLSYLSQKDYLRAIDTFSILSRLFPKYLEITHYLGLAHLENSNIDKASTSTSATCPSPLPL